MRVDLTLAPDGAWTGAIGKAQTAGTATLKGAT
jgi:hypothetical protein